MDKFNLEGCEWLINMPLSGLQTVQQAKDVEFVENMLPVFRFV